MEKFLQHKIISALIVSIVGLGILVIFSGSPETDGKDKKEIAKTKETTVVIDYGNGTSRRFRGNGIAFMKNENAWSVLQRAAATAHIPLEITRGFYPVVINGKRNGEEGKQWVLYVNGDRHADNAPFEIAIKEGDGVVWRFE